ncbi:MAG: sorbosone dehydrogenase family protein [Hyphomonas sp.]|eukprot:GHVR01104247.1.p1 GENE.GHVR01104247.1~~GHVR01104247.1.p1  ORF type:complete len:441 (+),score=72.54 GHVR01104247.1:266-1588(+)
MKPRTAATAAVVLALGAALGACSGIQPAPVETGFGPAPSLPKPANSLLPTVNIAEARAWTGDAKPTPAAGLAVTQFAANLDHPRWLYQLPNGDVLVAETNGPPRPEDSKGIRGFFMKRIMAKAGATVPSANRISLLRDADADGVAETHTTFLSGLNSPFGMTLVGDTLYIANTDGIVTVPYTEGETTISAAPEVFFTLPAGPINHHWTKNVIASPDGTKLYAAVGSNSNVAENGMEAEEGRAAIWEIDIASREGRVMATGLRNPVGMDIDPATGTLFTVVNERDELGDNLVPDYLTSVKDGAFYGWPYSYYGQNVDDRVEPQKPDLVASAISPDYALGAHTASLGLDLTSGSTGAMVARFGDGAFIGQHGSWNRKPRSGYKVIFVPFANGLPSGEPTTVLDDFMTDDIAHGRPVGVLLDQSGGLLVADDVGNRIWRVTVQ